MKLFILIFMIVGANSFAQDLSNPELDFYKEAPVNESEYSEEELINIQESEEEVPYNEEYDDEVWREEHQRELQQMEEDYVE